MKSKYKFQAVRLKQLMGERKQQEFSDMLNIKQGQMTKYLSGSTQPTAAIVAKIAVGAGVSMEWLMGVSDDPKLTIGDLSADEQKAVMAVRNRSIKQLLKLGLDFPEGGAGEGEPPVQ